MADVNGGERSIVVRAGVLLLSGVLACLLGPLGCGRKSSSGGDGRGTLGGDGGPGAGGGGPAGDAGSGGSAGAAGAAGRDGGTGPDGPTGTGSAGATGTGGTGTGGSGSGGAGRGGSAGALCGNRIVEPGEGCDDGNAQTGDGCSPSCRKIAGVSRGWGQIVVLLDDGSIKAWGDNEHGALGLGDTSARGDNPNEMGANLPAVDLGTDPRAGSVASGTAATCATVGSRIKCWGANTLGALGLGDENPRGDGPGEMGENLPFVDLGTGRYATTGIAVGGEQVCVVLDNRSLKCWGSGRNGALGLGNTDAHGAAPGQMGDNLPLVDLGTSQSPRDIVAGGAHTCAPLGSNQLKCWGLNASGQLGLGDKNNRGDGPGEMGNALPNIDLGFGRVARSVSAGGNHTCAWLDDSMVKCWGDNSSGQLGTGDTNNRGDDPGEMGEALRWIDLGPSRMARQVVTGDAHTCVLMDNNNVKCWGNNAAGQLGLGDTNNRGASPDTAPSTLPTVSLGTGRTVKTLIATQQGACALLDNDTLKCWGENTKGQLGLGDTNNRGDAPGEMGDALPAAVIP